LKELSFSFPHCGGGQKRKEKKRREREDRLSPLPPHLRCSQGERRRIKIILSSPQSRGGQYREKKKKRKGKKNRRRLLPLPRARTGQKGKRGTVILILNTFETGEKKGKKRDGIFHPLTTLPTLRHHWKRKVVSFCENGNAPVGGRVREKKEKGKGGSPTSCPTTATCNRDWSTLKGEATQHPYLLTEI